MSGLRIVFGVGATKAGTSWLHEWLAGHPECHFRGIKEVHYFDALEYGWMPGRMKELEAERDAVIARGGSERRIEDLGDCIQVFREASSTRDYLDYLLAGRGKKAVVGEVTPAYGLLPVSRLKEMVELGETRFLYVLRDPVARLWSHVRMIARRREPDRSLAEERAAWILRRTLRGEEDHIVVRGDYRGAMERLTEAVPATRRLFVFFEELVSGAAAGRVCEFLGIAPHPMLDRVIHAGRSLAMKRGQMRAARAFLDDQYAYVERTMGPVPEAWQRYENV